MCFLDDATSDYAITITTAQKLVYRVDAGALAHYKEGPRLRELSPPRHWRTGRGITQPKARYVH